MNSKRIWAVRAGSAGQADRIFLEMNQLAISFADIGDQLSELPASRDAFKQIVARYTQPARPGAVPVHAGQLYRFVHDMHIGDRIVYPRKMDRTLHWGEIVGPYVFDTEGSSEFTHRRSVQWTAVLSRDCFTQGALYELGSTLTLFEVKSFAGEIFARFEPDGKAIANGMMLFPEDAGDEAAVCDIAESTNDFISRKLRAELKGYPFEPFVADLFRAMGYRAKETRAVRDDGVDVIAHRDELGIEPPILKIQVKTSDANIGSDAVKAFYAMVHQRDVGIFITTGGFSAAARDFARMKGNLKLVAGVELIGLIQKYYDGLDLKFRQQIPLRRVLVPDVALEVA